jgi:hypothetical protein
MASIPITFTLQDFVAAERLVKKGRVWPRLLLAIFGAMTVLLALYLARWYAQRPGVHLSLDALEPVLICGAIAGYAAYLMTDIPARRAYRRLGWGREPVLHEWSSHGLKLRDRETTLRFDWQEVRKWVEDADSLVIFFAGRLVRLPKRAIPPEAQEELKRCLEGGRSAPQPRPLSGSARRWIEITEADFVAAHVAVRSRKIFWALGAFGLISVIGTIGWSRGETGLAWPTMACWAVLLWALMGGVKGGAKRVYSQLRKAGEPFEFTWSATGLEGRGAKREMRTEWDAFQSVKETPDALIALSQTGFIAFPKRLLTTSELEELRGYLSIVPRKG